MLQVTREIVTDVTVRSTGKAVIAKQNDTGSRFLNVHIQESGKTVNITSPATVIFNVLRPDGSSGEFYGSVNDDGTVRVGLTSWILGQAGIVSCDVSIVDGDAKLTTMTFYIEVEPAVCCDEDIEETDEYNVMVDLLERVSKACTDSETIVANCGEAIDAANAATDAATDAANAANAATDAANAAAGLVGDNLEEACEAVEKSLREGPAFIDKIKEQNREAQLQMWLGTEEEYQDVDEKNLIPNCVYFVGDTTDEDINTAIEEMKKDIENLATGKAPRGLVETHFYCFTDEEIENAIKNTYAAMPDNSIRNITIYVGETGLTLYGGTTHLTLNKTDDKWGAIEAIRYNNPPYPVMKTFRGIYDGVWSDWLSGVVTQNPFGKVLFEATDKNSFIYDMGFASVSELHKYKVVAIHLTNRLPGENGLYLACEKIILCTVKLNTYNKQFYSASGDSGVKFLSEEFYNGMLDDTTAAAGVINVILSEGNSDNAYLCCIDTILCSSVPYANKRFGISKIVGLY